MVYEKNNKLVDVYLTHFGGFDGVFEELTEAEQVFLCVWDIVNEVNNGGFGQYYYNPSGNRSFFACAALEKIGARGDSGWA